MGLAAATAAAAAAAVTTVSNGGREATPAELGMAAAAVAAGGITGSSSFGGLVLGHNPPGVRQVVPGGPTWGARAWRTACFPLVEGGSSEGVGCGPWSPDGFLPSAVWALHTNMYICWGISLVGSTSLEGMRLR